VFVTLFFLTKIKKTVCNFSVINCLLNICIISGIDFMIINANYQAELFFKGIGVFVAVCWLRDKL
jgi:hypothetical protein